MEPSTIAAPAGWFQLTVSDRIATPRNVEKIGIT